MDDLELDRELQAALDVTPSPEFVARVRGAVAERPNMQVVPRWLPPAVAAAACIALVVATFVARPRHAAVDTPAKVAITAEPPPMTFEPPPVVQAPTRSPRPVSAAVKNPWAVPEVLVADADKRAFEDFVATIHQRQFAAAFEHVPESTPWMVSELTLAPLTIEPLDSDTPSSSVVHN